LGARESTGDEFEVILKLENVLNGPKKRKVNKRHAHLMGSLRLSPRPWVNLMRGLFMSILLLLAGTESTWWIAVLDPFLIVGDAMLIF